MRAHCQNGMSLVELMIAMTLGLLLTAGMLTLFLSALQSSRNLTAGKQLENELHGILDLIARDLRRAGAMGNPLRQMEGMSNPFGVDPASAYAGEAANSCMTASYDLNGNGALDTAAADERFGYRLRAGVVQVRAGGQACTASTTPPWTDVTSALQVTVTALQFAASSAVNRRVTQRSVTVTIAGVLAGDAGVARSLSRTVRVRNDGFAP